MQFGDLLNVVMLSRLFYGFKDKSISRGKLFVVIIFQFVSLLILELSLKTLLLIVLLAVLDILSFYLERNRKQLNLIRLIFIVSVFILCGIFSSVLVPDNFNQNIINLVNGFENNSVLISEASRIDWQKFNLILCGSLFLLNEMNFGIRYFFEIFNLIPQENKVNNKSEEKIDNKEYNTGRIIGMLERILIFLFCAAGTVCSDRLYNCGKGIYQI